MATGGGDTEPDTSLSLTEEGASLAEPFESRTTTELRWWLLCRGISVPTSWEKAQVVNRYEVPPSYIYDQHKLVHCILYM